MSIVSWILWAIAIFSGLLAVYVAFVSAKAISVKANLSLFDDRRELPIGNVEIIGADPAQVAEAVNSFEDAWTSGPVEVEMDGIEVGDVE